MVGLQRPPAVVSWALPPAFGCTACRLRRAGTRNRHAPKCAAPNKFGSFGQFRVPAPLRGWEGARALPPRSFLADLVRSGPVFRPKTTRLPHQVCHLDRLGCCPNPCCAPAVFSSRAHSKYTSHDPQKPLQPNLKPAVSGLFVWPFSVAPAVPDGTGLRPGCALSQQVASSHFWLRPTGSRQNALQAFLIDWQWVGINRGLKTP